MDDNFPDVPEEINHVTPRLRARLVAAGILPDASPPTFHRLIAAARDQIWTAAAVHLVQTRRPNLLLLHLLATDSMQHLYPLLDINETPGKLNAIKYPMIAQKSEKPRLGIYHFNSGTTVYINPKNNPQDYLTNLAWTPDAKYLIIAELNRGQNDMCLNLYDASLGKFTKTLLNETNDRWVEPEHPAFFPSKSSNNFVWISEKDGFNNLYYYDIEGNLLKKLTNNKFPVREIIGSNAKGTEIYFKATGEKGINMLGYKVNLKGNG